MSSGEEEFVIEKVLHRLEFDKLVQKALASEVRFNPESVKDGRSKHSKYGYLVHWKGFPLAERTWEPESILKKTAQLAQFKAENGMLPGHEKFEKTYGNGVWRNILLANPQVRGTRYLMTPEEKREDKEKQEARKEKLRLQNERLREEEARKMEKRREKMTTPDDPEKMFKKKKKKMLTVSESEDESSKAASSSTRIPKKKKKRSASLDRNQPSTSSKTVKRNSDDEEARHPQPSSSSNVPSQASRSVPALPGIRPLDLKTPRIQKKTPIDIPVATITPGYDDDVQPSLQATPTPEPMPDVADDLVVKLNTVQRLPSVERTASSGVSTCTLSDEENYQSAEDEETLEKARREMEQLKIELEKFPVVIEGTRDSRSFSHALNLRKLRRCQSTECLNDFFNDQADLEIFAKNYESSSRILVGERPAVIKVNPPAPSLLKNEKKVHMLTPQEEALLYENLAKENLERLEKIEHPFKENLRTMLPPLVTAYSKDDHVRFKEIFLKFIPNNANFDPHRFALIVFMVSYFKHLKWNADPKGTTIVEANVSKRHGTIREHNALCSENHRKCAWLRVFMELIPSKFRFIESSFQNYSGRKGDDGPFRDDVYFHCMRYGAECQKRLFFEFHKPIGQQEEDVGEYSVNKMHLLAVQYGNLQRVASYMSLGGADINALATEKSKKRVYRLHDYLKFWIHDNVTRPGFKDMSYYNNLLLMVRHTSESLEGFVKGKVNEMIMSRMNMMFKIHLDLTYPHILRCSPSNNKINGGDGAHQVLACLFLPLGIGLRDGLPDEKGAEEDKEVKHLRKAHENYVKLCSKQQGRLLVVLYRVEIEYTANVETGFQIPTFKHVASDDGFLIDDVNLLRQKPNLPGDVAHIELSEHKTLNTPGALYYVIKDEKREKELIVPGNSHIEIIGTFERPISFVAQIFYIKKNY